MPSSTAKNSPFSLYDFLGYLIPGIYFCALIFFIDYKYVGIESSYSICSFFYLDKFFMKCEQLEFLLLVSPFLLVIFYIIGHVISVLSNIIIEELPYFARLRKTFNYILYTQNDLNEQEMNVSHSNVKHCDYVKENDEFIKQHGCIRSVINFIFWAIPILPALKIQQLLFSPPITKDDVIDGIREENNFHRVQPIAMHVEARRKIKFIMACLFPDMSLDESKPNELSKFFHFIYHFVLENTHSHYDRIHNYVALYGFMRNMLMASVLHFFYALLIFIMTWVFCSFFPGLLFILILFSFLNGVFAYGYLKYARRYTEELIFLCCILKVNQENDI
ncbi:hypothetical protein CC99x_007765 [Candidatus Berkiella cookevillensis]|uniref:Uncharacterized protein n=1 Tax=Candidatus Berkiella cookevillensis TaxID=437022 RepID=A0A0Q9YLT7_9GAMM|nr:hypothetical protein [Candidatus Berkiella cookevillensis]MCS5708799.1 hypothetical protein [Candidatus Berkiella cookevillensis]